MGSVSYKSDNLFSIKETLIYAEKACEKSDTKIYARYALLFSSAAEALQSAKSTAKALGSIPFCIIKIPVSIYFLLGLPDDGTAEYIHHAFPGIKDVMKHAILAYFCFGNVIISPLVGFTKPNLNISYHHKIFELFEVKPYEKITKTVPVIENLKSLKGMKDIKKALNKLIISPLEYKEHAIKYGVKIENILLHGLPGCGKTHLVTILTNTIKEILGENKVVYHEISSATNGSPYVHGTALKIDEMFKKIEAEIKTGLFPVVFVDEIDCVLGTRVDDKNGHKSEEIELYLKKIEKLSGQALIISGTNNPTKLDAALKRTGRIGHHIFVGPPELQEREHILKGFLDKISSDLKDSDINVNELSKLTEGFSVSDLKALIERTTKNAFAYDCKHYDINNPTKINQKYLLETLKTIHPSCSKEKVLDYKNKNPEFFAKV